MYIAQTTLPPVGGGEKGITTNRVLGERRQRGWMTMIYGDVSTHVCTSSILILSLLVCDCGYYLYFYTLIDVSYISAPALLTYAH